MRSETRVILMHGPAWVTENARAYDEKTVRKIYKHAVTYKPSSFLYVVLTAANVKNMFMRKYDAYIIPIEHGSE